MGAHHRAEHLGRQGQVGLGHRAFDQQGRLHQVGEFIEELLGQVGAGLQCGGGRLHGGSDRGGAALAIHLYPRRSKGFGVGAGRGDREAGGSRGSPTSLGPVQPMAPAQAAGAHLGITARQGHRNHGGIEQGHQPAHGPRKAAFALGPTHEASALQARDPGGDAGSQQLGRRQARLPHPGKYKGSLGGVAHLQGAGLDAAALGKTDRRRGGHPIFEGLGRWRTLAVLLQVGGAGGQVRHQQGNAAGGAGDRDLAMAQAPLGQVPVHQDLKLGQGQAGEIGGQLLGADLKQKGRHGASASNGLSLWRGRGLGRRWGRCPAAGRASKACSAFGPLEAALSLDPVEPGSCRLLLGRCNPTTKWAGAFRYGRPR